MKAMSLLENLLIINHFKELKVFAKEYFRFFWGNMNSGGAGKVRSGAIGTLLGGLSNIS
jgi:hypothetical protein